ncbi:carboxylesterase/lipase family protein [Kribbella sp. DT2]|uniref:carboxylesterase/lipase family protein n=1 Tax=Kribbella sp. DT2 TaxID=3393427 RepID=UPI003CF65047
MNLRHRTNTRRIAACLAIAGLLSACTSKAADSKAADPEVSRDAPLTVQTSSGQLQGTAAGSARQFLGVRYGQSVAGEHRWTNPVLAPQASGVVPATKPGPSCAQAGTAPGAEATASTNEDCLFLNVTTPKQLREDEKLPVMVWWHGGGYTSGSGAAYDAQRLANRGHVMVVTVNYRLGVFGYLSLPGLPGSGNFGLADQILATTWARQNADAFGGDPGNITVFGESAGGMSACALLTSPAARDLVSKVAMSSGSCKLDWPNGGLAPGLPAQTPYTSLAAGEQFGQAQAKTLSCTGAAALNCLRGKPVAELLKIFGNFSNVLTYGTPLLPKDLSRALDDGDVADGVRVLSGGNQNEQAAIVAGVQSVKPFYTAATYPTLLKEAFGANASKVAAQYPLDGYPNAASAFAQLVTDASWACPTLRGNAALAGHGVAVFGYEFADPDSPNVNGVPTKEVKQGAAHATDVPYLFDLTGKNLLKTAAQQALANQMIDYWTSFARSGTPSATDAPGWPQLTGADGPTLQLAPTTKPVDLAAEHHCGLWATIDF